MLLCLALLGLVCNAFPVLAQENRLPPWLVPVVQIVSDSEVVPTTGIALGGDRVLVPVEFTATDRTLVVLDGGGDLVRHGRPARVETRLNLAGLAVLSAAGLDRTGPVLAEGPPPDGAVTALLAFPTPEGIRQGLRSLRREVQVAVDEQGRRRIDPATPLPNLTGALVNACGQWQGYSAARGTPTLTTSRNTLYQWLPDLAQALTRAGVTLQVAPCERTLVLAPPQPVAEPSAEPPPEPESQPEPETQTDKDTEPEAESPEVPAPPEEEVLDALPEPSAPSDAAEDPVVDAIEPDEADAPISSPGNESVSEEGTRSEDVAEAPILDTPVAEPVPAIAAEDPVQDPERTPLLPWVLGLLAMLALATWLWRRRARHTAPTPEHPLPVAPQVRQRPVWQLVGPDLLLDLVPGPDGISLSLGRFDADLLVMDRSVSRLHGRLDGDEQTLRYTDLGAMNGSRINGLPCEPGKAMALEAGDTLQLGQVSLELRRADEAEAPS